MTARPCAEYVFGAVNLIESIDSLFEPELAAVNGFTKTVPLTGVVNTKLFAPLAAVPLVVMYETIIAEPSDSCDPIIPSPN